MVYDCFSFFNELDLLEIRLNILSPVVDKFVLVEADRTHSNKPKPLFFDINKERYNEFLNKIIYIKVTDYPEVETSWTIENYQRNMIMGGLKDCKPDDVIVISDIDEIPDPKIIKKYVNKMNGLYKMRQIYFAYYLNYRNIIHKYWYGTAILRYQDILDNITERYDYVYNEYCIEKLNKGCTITKIRTILSIPRIKNAGWHYTSLGGIKMITDKLQSFSHQEFNKSEYLNNEYLQKKIANGMDFVNRKDYRFMPIKIRRPYFPEYIVKNQDKYKALIFSDINGFRNIILLLKMNIYYYLYLFPCKVLQKIKRML